MALSSGTRLGPYVIMSPLGAGGMGEVYRARDTRVGREVAVKILPPEFATDPRRRLRFEQEARLAASLNHPNIVGLFDVGTDLDPPYIVSELVAGISLRTLMGRGAISLRKVLDLGAQMAEGLAAAHGAGVVHRDMKPENVMVTPEGRVKILDFGLARAQRERGVGGTGAGASRADTQAATVGMETQHATSPGAVVGTVAYMSPEQASGQSVDFRSDQFSLGLVLYEMLGRRRAFERKTSVQTMAAIIDEEAPALPAGIPTQVRWIVERCLAKEPSHRYASTEDLAQELRHLRGHVGDLTSSSVETVAAARRRSMRDVRILAAIAAAIALVALSVGRLSVDGPQVDLAPYRIKPFATMLKTSESPSWSPDGKSIAFRGRMEEGAGYQIYIQRVDAPAPVQITRRPFIPGSDLSWTSDSRLIYCWGRMGDRSGIFRIAAAGGDPILVQPNAKSVTMSPDGGTLVMVASETRMEPQRVYYASPPDAPRRLYEPVPFLDGTMDPLSIAFSPDGKKVIAVTPQGECWLLPWPPGKGSRLRGLEGRGLGRFSWMPDSRHVVSSPGGLYMADTRTGKQWPILVGGGTGLVGASVSPDGRRIAYAASVRRVDVIELPLDGRPSRTLIGSRRNEWCPALSADGKELAYVTNARGLAEVWSMDMENGSFRRIITPGDVPADSGSAVTAVHVPALSRDRRRIAFEGISSRGIRLYVALTAGGVPMRVTEQVEDRYERSPTWSPDGDRLAYIRQSSDKPLQVVRPGGTEPPVPIWEGETWVPPEWSPSGEWIAVADSTHVILVSPDGRAKRDLRSKRGALAWAPDGRTLYVIHAEDDRGSVGAVDVLTGLERPILSELGENVPPLMYPGTRVSVTPDGKALVYAVQRGGADIWLLEGAKTPEPWYARLWPW